MNSIQKMNQLKKIAQMIIDTTEKCDPPMPWMLEIREKCDPPMRWMLEISEDEFAQRAISKISDMVDIANSVLTAD